MPLALDARQPCLDIEGGGTKSPVPKSMSARLTSFTLNADDRHSSFGGLGLDFGAACERADSIFTRDILPMAPNMKGFVHCQRIMNKQTGEFKILSLWETPEDCAASGDNDEYYSNNLGKLRSCARYGMFKTEQFEVWKLHPDDDVITTPYARVSVMELNGGTNAQEEADEVLRSAIRQAKEKPGFVGAQRLLGTGDASGTYVVISYWDSCAALRASSSGSEYYDRYVGKFEDEHGPAKGFRRSLKPGTDIATHEFDHLHFDTPKAAVPYMEPGSTFAATFQLSCISFGVGVFAMPGVFAQVGVLLGTFLLAAFAILSNLGMQLMLQIATATGASTYEDVLRHAFGPVGRAVALISLALSTFTANCAHMQFVASMFVEMQGPGGGLMQTLVGPDVKLQHLATMIMFGSVTLPLCFKRQLSELRFVSLGVVLCCFLCCCVVISKCLALIKEDGAYNTDELWSKPSAGLIFDTAPVVAFGFSSIAELFHVRAEIKKPELLSRCAHVATGIVVSLYFAVWFICALAFEKPGSNVLENFPGNHLIAIFRMAILVMVVMLYPIINFPCMQAIDALIAGRFGTSSTWRWKLEAMIGFALVVVIDTMVTRLDYLFGLCGSLGLGLIAYTLPGAAALAVAFRMPGAVLVHGSLSARVVQVASAVFILAVGLVMTFGSTAWIIYGIAQGH